MNSPPSHLPPRFPVGRIPPKRPRAFAAARDGEAPAVFGVLFPGIASR